MPAMTAKLAAPTAKLAAPCANCGTRAGSGAYGQRPFRARLLCKACYGEAKRAGRLEAWPLPPPRGGVALAITCAHCGKAFRAKPSQHRRYCSQACSNAHNARVARPLPPIVRLADVGITPAEIAARLAAAARRLLAETRRAELRGLAWRQAHPGQFAPSSIAALFPFGLACARWAGTDAREAAP